MTFNTFSFHISAFMEIRLKKNVLLNWVVDQMNIKLMVEILRVWRLMRISLIGHFLLHLLEMKWTGVKVTKSFYAHPILTWQLTLYVCGRFWWGQRLRHSAFKSAEGIFFFSQPTGRHVTLALALITRPRRPCRQAGGCVSFLQWCRHMNRV